MGFPFPDASWDGVTGAMYMGAGGSMPLVYTLLAAAVCIYALWQGNKNEHALYDKHK